MKKLKKVVSNLKNSSVKALVITGYGLNCERETSAAFESCGAQVSQIHLKDLTETPEKLHEFQILAFIGGFSFGDHLGAGTVFANRVKYQLKNELSDFINAGKLIVGICNGFQTITRLGLVPAIGGALFQQNVALAHNDSGVFRDDWVNLKVDNNTPCVFTKGIDSLRLPIRHGEGKFVAEEDVLDQLEQQGLVVLRYTDENGGPNPSFPANPNGSLRDIAGICDPTGRIFGLMPHPEAFLSPFNDPRWTKLKLTGELPEKGDGAAIFQNAVDYAANA